MARAELAPRTMPVTSQWQMPDMGGFVWKWGTPQWQFFTEGKLLTIHKMLGYPVFTEIHILRICCVWNAQVSPTSALVDRFRGGYPKVMFQWFLMMLECVLPKKTWVLKPPTRLVLFTIWWLFTEYLLVPNKKKGPRVFIAGLTTRGDWNESTWLLLLDLRSGAWRGFGHDWL